MTASLKRTVRFYAREGGALQPAIAESRLSIYDSQPKRSNPHLSILNSVNVSTSMPLDAMFPEASSAPPQLPFAQLENR
jgi:hypothetical protein